MKFKAIIVVLVLTISQVVFDSCCKINTTFKIDGFAIANLDNSGGTPVEIAVNEGVSKNAYGIRIFLSTKLNTAQNSLKNFQFISNSYALACKQDYSLYNKIRSIKVVTLTDFDGAHLSGEEVTEYFNGLSNEYGPYVSIKDKINELNSSLVEMPEYFDIYLMKQPTQSDYYWFNITIELNDGTITDLRTDYVTLF